MLLMSDVPVCGPWAGVLTVPVSLLASSSLSAHLSTFSQKEAHIRLWAASLHSPVSLLAEVSYVLRMSER